MGYAFLVASGGTTLHSGTDSARACAALIAAIRSGTSGALELYVLNSPEWGQRRLLASVEPGSAVIDFHCPFGALLVVS